MRADAPAADSDVQRTPAVRRLSPAALGASALAGAYTSGDPRALAFYRHSPYSPDAQAEAAATAAAHPRDREALADVLREQNEGWGASEEVLRCIERLREPDSAAVVTGQQLGLFGGPLFTIHKALTAVHYAAHLAAETGRPVVPVFWLADEDHDYAEVHTAPFLAGEEVARAVYTDGQPPELNRGPVGRIVLGAESTEALDELEAHLPEGPFRAELLAGLRSAWAPGTLWRDAFARTLRLLLPDVPLVLFSADSPRVKRLVAPLLPAEVEGWAETHHAHELQSERLKAAGYPVQVAPRPLHLFLFEDGQRHALDVGEDGGVTVRGTDRRLSAADLAAIARDTPERLSPDVVLRPVMQDVLFPTAAYVASPGEAAYFAQVAPVYERFGVPMPVIYPRASFTLVEPGIRRRLEALGLDVLDAREDPDRLHARLALAAAGSDLDARLAEADAAIAAAVAAVQQSATQIDASLAPAAGAAESAVTAALQKLRRKTVRVAKRRQAETGAQVRTAHAALFPGGIPQERVLTALGLWARYGPHLARLLPTEAFLDTSEHAVVELP